MAKRPLDPGLGLKFNRDAQRIINKDGTFNVNRKGPKFSFRNTYQWLIKMSWRKFLLIVFAFLLVVNAIFAIIYLAIGVEFLVGMEMKSFGHNFLEAYYFSFQTFTTVGYGHIYPIGHGANLVATLESVLGWMCFALVTGLLYGRFSKAKARLLYSEKALISPYQQGQALMFRVANWRNSLLMEMEATLMVTYVDNGSRRYAPLEMELSKILYFPLNWTLVHHIGKESPLYNKTEEDFRKMDIEVLILLKGFDDTFNEMVHSRYSYKWSEMIWKARFLPAYETDGLGNIVFSLNKIHDYETVT